VLRRQITKYLSMGPKPPRKRHAQTALVLNRSSNFGRDTMQEGGSHYRPYPFPLTSLCFLDRTVSFYAAITQSLTAGRITEEGADVPWELLFTRNGAPRCHDIVGRWCSFCAQVNVVAEGYGAALLLDGRRVIRGIFSRREMARRSGRLGCDRLRSTGIWRRS